MKQRVSAICLLCLLVQVVYGQGTQPIVAIHDSELTRALDSSNSPAISPTPTGPGTTGLQWWTTNWHYFVMPESLKEAFRSDGTAHTVVGDSNITAGGLLTNGAPKYPILISLAAEAIRDDEIAPLTNYVAAGGFLLVGSSAFTRNTNGTPRSDFAFANELGVHDSGTGLTNWTGNNYFTKQIDHRLISHVPGGQLTWRMPRSSEEISWGTSPSHNFLDAHLLWRVQATTNVVILAQGDSYPYLTVRPYGRGYFIYCAAMQPLLGHGGFAPGMYSYVIFRRAVEWAFESLNLPVAKTSPWPFAYDATLMVRHDLENFTNEVASIEASALFEYTNGAKGDYYFCTGTLREDASPAFNTNDMVAGLRRAITNYGATIGSHNGGLKNPNNPALLRGQYEYWHWGPDEALDVTPTNYASGKAYAFSSISNSFLDLEAWLTGVTNGIRSFTGCYFNATREDSYDIEDQLNIKFVGDQKISVFPHWTLSTRTAGKRHPTLSTPVSDWFVGGLVAQSLEPWHPPGVHTSATIHDAVDFYYSLGGVISLYSHTLSTGLGPAGSLASDYVTYSMNTNLHPRLWAANAVELYQWWLQRSNAQLSASFITNGSESVTTLAVSGAASSNLTVELLVPGSGSAFALQVLTNGVATGTGNFRTNGQTIKVRVGTAVTNAQVRYVLGPRAQNDSYTSGAGAILNVGAPGVLANDGRGNSSNLTATLVTAATNGTVILNTNGGFTYTPSNNLVFSDAFTYRATDELTNSSTATVTISLTASEDLFKDDFTRPTEPGTLSPWVAQSGTWTVANGVLVGGTNLTQTYGSVYVTNTWTNYSVEARLQFPSNAFGAGLGGRVTPASGKHYAAWVYPEGSVGGSNVLKLIKFSSWTTFDYTNTSSVPMQQVNLASVGTNSHTVKLAFQTNQIAVYFDGVQKMSVTDVEAQPYQSGSVCVDMWRESTAYLLGVDDVTVNVLVRNDAYSLNEDSTLVVPGPGVLSNDTPVFGTNLVAVLVTGPTNGSLALSNDGSFSYSPATNFNGVDHFTYRAIDGETNLGSATVTLTINSVNDPPVLPAQGGRTVAELSLMTVTNAATDADVPANILSYVLVNSPPGAQIDTNGIIRWLPGEAEGPSTNTITTIVTDDGAPALSATNSFVVVVTEVNTAPVLPSQANRTVAELALLLVTNAATDADLPPNGLAYSLVNAPAGAGIDSTGVITWTPSEAQGPGTNTITTIVTDNGVPPLSATNSFVVVVTEVNSAPVLPGQGNRTVAELVALIVTNTAVDADTPANSLSYSLSNPPAGAAISGGGVITWTPNEAQGPGTNTITTIVTDDGAPPLSATNSFVVVVTEVNTAPVLPSQTNRTVVELAALVVTNAATDGDIPANSLVYALADPPAGAAIDSAGVITWTPSEAQGPGTNTITTIVTDDGAPPLSATNSFVVVVTEVNSAPVLPSQTDHTVAELAALIVTNTATDGDIPANTLAYSLANAPAGATIDASGVITWTPSEAQGPGTNTITTIVTDDGAPPLSATNSFVVVVTEVNSAPVLPSQTDHTVAELAALIVTNTATDGDIPANTLAYSLANAPAGATIDASGVISWTPGETQGPGTNTITTVVTDDGVPALSSTNSFVVVVTEVNAVPVLPPQTDRTVAELTFLVVTNAATDGDFPANNFSYVLANAPAGATINGAGVITWTPNEAQGPGTNTITTIVTDDGVPPLSATNSFVVVVTEVNSAPVLPIQTNRTISELTILSVKNEAVDADIPGNSLVYSLANAPIGATIDSLGVITWTPSEAQGPGTNTLTTIVTDNGVPALSATNSFLVVVTEVNVAPALPQLDDRSVPELTPLTVSNAANDPDLPANRLTYVLINPPTGAQIDTEGTIRWTPSEEQGPGTSTIVTVVTDDGVPPLSATNAFQVLVTEVNSAPSLPSQPDRTVSALSILIVTNTATDPDLPANHLEYGLVDPPAGATIDSNGVISWTSTPAEASTTNAIVTFVVDDGVPALSATNSFNVVVSEMVPLPVVLSLNLSDSTVTVIWSAVMGKLYQLQFTDSLLETNWTAVSPDILATGLTASQTNSVDGVDQRFYRVKLLP